MNQELYNEAVRSNILSRRLIEQLLESMNYSSISFINWTVEILKVIRTRLERGDKITDEVSSVTYTLDSFHDFVKRIFLLILKARFLQSLPKRKKSTSLWSPVMTDTALSWLILPKTKHTSGFPV